MVRGGFELAARLLSFPAPVVIACTGHAIAMGSFLLLSADYRIGADGPYKITANEVAIGMTMPRGRDRDLPSAAQPAAHLTRALDPGRDVRAGRRGRGRGFLDRSCPPASWPAPPPPRPPGWPRWTGPRTPPPSCGSAAGALAAIQADLEASGAGLRGLGRREQRARAKQRTPALRDHVLNVAIATLAADGVAGFTTRRVAEQAQTSTPAVYELFGDKAGLVREVFFEGFRLLRRAVRRAGRRRRDPRADLAAVIAALPGLRPRQPGPGPADVLPAVRRLRPRPGRAGRPARPSASSSSAGSGGAPARACCAATTPTSRTCSGAGPGAGRAGERRAGWAARASSRDRRWELAIEAVLDGLG